jgi:hypothetical protein
MSPSTLAAESGEVALTGLAEVMDQADPPAGAVELGPEGIQEGAGGALRGGQVGPPAVVAQLVLEVPPDALDQIQVGGGAGARSNGLTTAQLTSSAHPVRAPSGIRREPR